MSRSLTILADRCVGCGRCVKVCPFGALSLNPQRKAVVDREVCTLCGACATACPKYQAIQFSDLAAADSPRRAAGDVWVFCETEADHDVLASVSIELLGLACQLADKLGVKVGAVLLGSGLEKALTQAAEYGADQVIFSESPSLKHFDDQRYAAVFEELIREFDPEILLGGATAVGRALLPRLAVLLHTGLTADCTELDIDPESGLLRQTRPAFGGNILATITTDHHRPQMATVRPAVLPAPEAQAGRQAEMIRRTPAASLLSSPVEWLSFTPRDSSGVDLREAEIIVTAGYGVNGTEGVALVEKLAQALGGVLGASRPVVDAGWADYSHQVGQTGTTVQPRLYIACGVSGAIQHIVGMKSAETIVAINRDPEAPIFAHADYALVGDLFEIIPAIIEQLKG